MVGAVLNLSSNVDEVLDTVARMSRQYPFAVAKALTDVTRMVAKAMPAEVQADLDEPTPFTRGGFYSTRADKLQLVAHVGVKDLQAKYMRWQVEGGTRRPARSALRLPSILDLDEFGNLPKGTIKRLVAAARSGRKLSGKAAKQMGVAQRSEIFYGVPRGGPQRPAGLYSRRNSSGQRSLVPLVVFPKMPAHYRKRFDFYLKAEKIVRAEFKSALRAAWSLANATARR